MINLRKIAFHESTLKNLSMTNHEVKLEIEDARIDGKKSRVLIDVESTQRLLVDGNLSETLDLEAEDGEVLTLVVLDKSLKIIIEWNDFSSRRAWTKSYEIFGKRIFIREGD